MLKSLSSYPSQSLSKHQQPYYSPQFALLYAKPPSDKYELERRTKHRQRYIYRHFQPEQPNVLNVIPVHEIGIQLVILRNYSKQKSLYQHRQRDFYL